MKTHNLIKIFETLEKRVLSNSYKAFKLLLIIMSTDPNPVHVKELVRMNGTSAMRTSKLLDSLCASGLITVIKSADDLRKKDVTLSNQGRKLKEILENADYKIKN
tara:strand:+ start:308 stop:622 length:315 start_codon:yes stop_codon:yes gene_type:complete